MARLLAIKGQFISGPVKPSPYAYALGITTLILPGIGQTGYECVSGKFGTLVGGIGSITTSSSGKAYKTTGANNNGGQKHLMPNTTAGSLGYTLLFLGAAYSAGENSLGRFIATNGFNWYPFGGGSYTWTGVGTTGNNSFDYSTVLPLDGIERAVCFSYNPGPNMFTAPNPIITVNGVVATGTKTEFGGGTFVGLGPDVYINNASNNARCLDGYTSLVAIFDRPHNLNTMRTISAFPQLLLST